MAEVIDLEGPEGCPVSPQLLPDTSSDALLAQLLQAEEERQQLTVPSVCNLGEAREICHISEKCAEPQNCSAPDAPLVPGSTRPAKKRRVEAMPHAVALQQPVRQALAPVQLKLFIDDSTPVLLTLRPDDMLLSVLTAPAVKKKLRACVGLKSATPAQLADRLRLHKGAPEPKVFDHALAERTSVADALGTGGGVLRVSIAGCIDRLAASAPHALAVPAAAPAAPVAALAGGEPQGCEGVQVVRLRTPHTGLGSPIVLVKNFNCDRGLRLAHITGLREMVEMSPEAQRALTQNVRSELDAYPKGLAATSEVRRASDRVLDLCEEAVQEDPLAVQALRRRTEYASTAVLIYDQQTPLPRHVDNCGHWVVLFSFGLTVDFFCGESGLKFESGDALVFNGSRQDAVMHGIDKIHARATIAGGKTRKLPAEMEYLQKIRVSFQARQSDA
eukprot:CAMPEP_0179095494 /NCGR_PEP_ID=MMETSP0796-20121207/43846_1 /TAXON_ID=73915 /ORGANISM="Pyrodinium bahamense, Strain pbaha01" /LENGTH=444 /DNA_ID=CAMNT_0020793181 /DNA_START=40 /DNA_END=1374 /DNA_ORIENTATION=-